MEEQIKKVASHIKRNFAIFWLLSICGVIIGEVNDEWKGSYTEKFMFTYYIETLCILLTAICIPLSLKLFALKLRHKIDQEKLPQALLSYRKWSLYRLFLLSLPLFMGIILYYLTMSNTGVLCASIALVASLFCWPSEDRLRKDLHIFLPQE